MWVKNVSNMQKKGLACAHLSDSTLEKVKIKIKFSKSWGFFEILILLHDT